MFEIKDLDLSHVTTLHLTLVESGSLYVDKLYGDEKSLGKLMELLKKTDGSRVVEKDEKSEGEKPRGVDYSKSPLKNYLAHPEDVNRTLTWLHLHIDYQIDPMMKLQPLRALIENKVFTSPIPREIYEREFGPISQSGYSRCINSSDRYNAEGLKILAESYMTFDYEKFIMHI